MVNQAITSFICDMRYVLESAVGENNFSIMFEVSVFFFVLGKIPILKYCAIIWQVHLNVKCVFG